jgi:hypothetical protein
MKLGALMLGAYRVIIVICFWCISPIISMECPSLPHLIKVYFFQDQYCYPYLFSGAIGMVNLLPAFHSQSVIVSVDEVGLL